MNDATAPALALRGAVRIFQQGGQDLPVLNGVDLEVQPGEIVALVGPSGAGKSTLLQIAGLLDRPSEGSVTIGGREATALSDREASRLRMQAIGFVFQFHHLLPEFTARENVIIPQMIAGHSRKRAGERADELLSSVGLSHRLTHRPAQLSGGEQQRVAIARALANRPALLLADEPTGNLDTGTAGEVVTAMFDLLRASGTAAFIATHNPDLAARMDRVVALDSGTLHAA